MTRREKIGSDIADALRASTEYRTVMRAGGSLQVQVKSGKWFAITVEEKTS